MSQQEPFPFAPLVERCFELAVDISAEQFEEHASAFMNRIGEKLGLTQTKTLEHWEIRIEKPKGSPLLKPKATLYNILTISHEEKSERRDCSIETLHLKPATSSEPASLKFAQLKPQTSAIISFEEAKRRLITILSILHDTFGKDAVLQTTLSYWNDLYKFDNSHFQSGGIFNLSHTLRYFNDNSGMGAVVPPWNVVMNWAVQSRPGARVKLDIKGEWERIDVNRARNQLWTILEYLGKPSNDGVSSAECLAELDIAHAAIYEKFISILTPQALEYCKNGSLHNFTS